MCSDRASNIVDAVWSEDGGAVKQIVCFEDSNKPDARWIAGNVFGFFGLGLRPIPTAVKQIV